MPIWVWYYGLVPLMRRFFEKRFERKAYVSF